MEDKKIKDIYGCNYIVSDEKLYPLQEWYNKLIDKSISEIEVSDVLRMIRQKEFVDLAVSKAVDFLQDNVFIGEMYEGELLEKVSGIELTSLSFYSDKLKDILSDALEKSREHEWLCDEEREEFEEIVNNFSKNGLWSQ